MAISLIEPLKFLKLFKMNPLKASVKFWALWRHTQAWSDEAICMQKISAFDSMTLFGHFRDHEKFFFKFDATFIRSLEKNSEPRSIFLVRRRFQDFSCCVKRTSKYLCFIKLKI